MCIISSIFFNSSILILFCADVVLELHLARKKHISALKVIALKVIYANQI